MEDTKTDGTKKKSLYQDFVEQASLPLSERQAVVVGRKGNTVVPRRYHLTTDKISNNKNARSEKGRFVSPFRRGGAYWGVVEALATLGENQRHAFRSVADKMKEIMTDISTKDPKTGKTAWEKFEGRSSKNPEKARDSEGKIIQNLEVLQRLGGNHPYGFKLAQLGACINIFKSSESGEAGFYIELQTGIEGSPNPVNERRDRRTSRSINDVAAVRLITETDEKITQTIESQEK